LLFYENPHTPPSKSRKFLKKKEQKTPAKLGAPKGHAKYERPVPKPTKSVIYTEETCPHCQSNLGQPFKTQRVIEEEVPDPQPIEVTEHLISHYKCPHCSKHITAENNAPVGAFGKNMCTNIALMKFEDRLPLRKVVNTLERNYKVKISNVGVYKVMNRVANALKEPYQELIERIRLSKVVYADETQLKVNGITFYIWTFTTDTDSLFVIRKSRAKKVIDEILGVGYKGVICCDGWRAYSRYSDNLQRCWAHLIREAKSLSEKHVNFSWFYDAIRKIFEQIHKIREKPPPLGEREDLRNKLKRRLVKLIDKMNARSEFRKFATKLANGLDYWFTCVVNLLVEPTNNIAERALREFVVQRKIFGGLRRIKGTRIMEVIISIIASVKMRGKPVFETIRGYL